MLMNSYHICCYHNSIHYCYKSVCVCMYIYDILLYKNELMPPCICEEAIYIYLTGTSTSVYTHLRLPLYTIY
ncbi:hypothetical protein RchiOBHm_Chr6g0308361 [Rosa chinensis]|uniref:Uncharacterized protein n=1 Tax=Rosa chinensis TaxID=74649 RepID=A0A2P6Q0Q3_ROSCH|nr:hypothetical protein RchiOBHm_Chr6g0308361 [Rosa chinensis]